jgi:hypothetical protein
MTRMLLPGLALLLSLSAAGAAPAAPADSLRTRVFSAIDRLPWAETRKDIVRPWTRVVRSLAVEKVAFGPQWSAQLNENFVNCSGGDSGDVGCESGDCSCCIYATCSSGFDTVTFTPGQIEETCGGGSPWMTWRTAGLKPVRRQLAVLDAWNVDRLWMTSRHLVVHAQTSFEGCGEDDGIGILNLDTGRWAFYDAGSGNQTRRGSTDLRDLLPGDAPTEDGQPPAPRDVRIGELGGAVVLCGTDRAMAFWPLRHQWALLDPSTGAAIPPTPWLAWKKVRYVPEKKQPSALKAAVLRAFRARYPQVQSAMIRETLDFPFGPGIPMRAVIAGFASGAKNGQEWYSAVFLVGTTSVARPRWLHTAAREQFLTFDPEASRDSLVIVEADGDYGCVSSVHAFPPPRAPR